jgi:hypothetical protein
MEPHTPEQQAYLHTIELRSYLPFRTFSPIMEAQTIELRHYLEHADIGAMFFEDDAVPQTEENFISFGYDIWPQCEPMELDLALIKAECIKGMRSAFAEQGVVQWCWPNPQEGEWIGIRWKPNARGEVDRIMLPVYGYTRKYLEDNSKKSI